MSDSLRQALLTEAEAAAYLGGIPPRTLRQWRYTGHGPAFIKVGRHVRYSQDDLDAHVNAQRVQPQGAA